MVIDLVDRIYAGPIVWGSSDCCTRACDVFAALHGVDPMAPLRGRYSSAAEALHMIRARGGWLRMCNDLADAAPGGVGRARSLTTRWTGAAD